jgi:hypothetical protein
MTQVPSSLRRIRAQSGTGRNRVGFATGRRKAKRDPVLRTHGIHEL